MASWKKIIVSGSQADLAAVSASEGFVGTLITPAQTNITSLGTLSSIDVDGGAIDGAVIGANSAVAGTFTNLTSTGGVTASNIGHSSDGNLITLSNNTVTIGSGDTLKVDTIAEQGSSGVTVENVIFKDAQIGISGDTDLVTLTTNTASISGHISATTLEGDGTLITGIASTLQVTGSNGSKDTLNLKTEGLSFAVGSTDLTANVANNSVTHSLSSTITGVSQISNDGLTLQRADGNDKIDFAANDIIVTVGGSEVASFEDDKVVISKALDLGSQTVTTTGLGTLGTATVSNNLTVNNISASAGAKILGTERTATNGRPVGLYVQNDISASGVQAEFFEITSSVLVTSESTAFGNDLTDTHIFSGSINLTGSSDVILDVGPSNFIVAGKSKTNPNGTFTGSFSGDGSNLDLSSNSTIGSNIFATVSTTGGGDVVAEANNDTLALSSSDGIVVSGSVDEDKINFGLSNVPNTALANDGITIAGVDTSLGGEITQTTLLNGSTVVSQSEQLASDISGSFIGYLTGSGIVSQSSQVNADNITNFDTNVDARMDEKEVLSGSLATNLVSSGIISGAAESATQGNITFNTGDVSVGGLAVGDSPQFTNLTLTGDLTVTGKTTQVNLEQIQLADNFILLNSGSNTSTDVDSGITIKENDTSFRSFYWDAQSDRFSVHSSTSEIATDGAIAAKDYVMTVSSSVGAPTGTGNYGGSGTKKGQVVVSDNGDIWMYVD